MMYVSDRKADSIWETEEAFFWMKVEYSKSHCLGEVRVCAILRDGGAGCVC